MRRYLGIALIVAIVVCSRCAARTELSGDLVAEAPDADADAVFSDAKVGLEDSGRLPDGALNCATNAGPVNTCESDPDGIGYVLNCLPGYTCEYYVPAAEYGCCIGPLCEYGAPTQKCE